MITRIFDTIIIGGSYAGMSAAMCLGRALRQVLVIDSGQPCNAQTPHAHNFLTQDGRKPQEIAAVGKQQVLTYPTVHWLQGFATTGIQESGLFCIGLEDGQIFKAKKLLFATGVKDLLPPIPGLQECWGISALHCPYCHGYEMAKKPTGVIANGELGFELARLIQNWTKELTLFTNGLSTLSECQEVKLREHNIGIVTEEISHLLHDQGKLRSLIMKNGHEVMLSALYTKGSLKQHCTIPIDLGCAITEQGHLQVDGFQRTNVEGVYAAGDNTTLFRSVANAVAAGNLAGAIINRELVEQAF